MSIANAHSRLAQICMLTINDNCKQCRLVKLVNRHRVWPSEQNIE